MGTSPQSPQLRMAGWVITLVGGILVMGSQVMGLQSFMMLMAMIPSMPPEYAGMMQLSLQIILVNIAVAITMGVLVLIAAIIIYLRTGKLGGILAIIFAIPVFATSGLIGWIGAVLAIVGGALSLASTMKPPEPKPEII